MPKDQRLYMTFPIDFWTHPKVARLSDAEFRVFVEMNGHSRMIDSDGRVEVEDAEFMWDASALQNLAKSHPTRPLVFRDGDSYVLRDYAEHQMTKADRDALTEKRRKAAEARWKNASALQVDSKPMQTDAEKELEKEITNSKELVARKRASTVPLKFKITDEMREWAAQAVPLVDLDAKLPEWIDYWRGTGKTMKDWVSVWRNGMRKQQEFAERDRAKAGVSVKPKKVFKAHAD